MVAHARALVTPGRTTLPSLSPAHTAVMSSNQERSISALVDPSPLRCSGSVHQRSARSMAVSQSVQQEHQASPHTLRGCAMLPWMCTTLPHESARWTRWTYRIRRQSFLMADRKSKLRCALKIVPDG
eukprot:365313-Chlamydomonas_euryale.AAC.3